MPATALLPPSGEPGVEDDAAGRRRARRSCAGGHFWLCRSFAQCACGKRRAHGRDKAAGAAGDEACCTAARGCSPSKGCKRKSDSPVVSALTGGPCKPLYLLVAPLVRVLPPLRRAVSSVDAVATGSTSPISRCPRVFMELTRTESPSSGAWSHIKGHDLDLSDQYHCSRIGQDGAAALDHHFDAEPRACNTSPPPFPYDSSAGSCHEASNRPTLPALITAEYIRASGDGSAAQLFLPEHSRRFMHGWSLDFLFTDPVNKDTDFEAYVEAKCTDNSVWLQKRERLQDMQRKRMAMPQLDHTRLALDACDYCLSASVSLRACALMDPAHAHWTHCSSDALSH
eukprot:SM000136S00151  [mRNA]  locus=s136:37:1429:+ [translate_table: standard]